MGLKGFERRVERMVEGVFGTVFKGGIRPVELGRRLVREMDDERTVDVRGRAVVPNHFTIELSSADHDQFADVADTLSRELADAAREHARDEGYNFLGPVEVDIVANEALRTGSFQITGRMKQGAAAPAPGRCSSRPTTACRSASRSSPSGGYPRATSSWPTRT